MFEKLSIQHIPDDKRHGRVFSVFTLWLASNLTIADYALGSLFYGLPFKYILVLITVGNILGGLLLSLAVAMGPKLGYPQMMISQGVFGKLGNKPFAALNWVSTAGWYTVNIILGSYALELLADLSFIEAASLLSIVQALLALYGYDIIHHFERAMAIVLGLLFVCGIAIIYPLFTSHFSQYETSSSFNPYYFALVLAAVFSYLMSWSPYASDYSRYLNPATSKVRLIIYALLGGALASGISELFGVMVFIAVGNPSLNAIEATYRLGGFIAYVAVAAIVLGAIAANALNLYTNSLSAVTFYQRTRRSSAVILAVVVGFLLALVGQGSFGTFYEDFLLTLDYWITPWLGIMIAAFYISKVIKPESVEGASSAGWKPLLSYFAALLVSIPFMNLASYSIPFEGPVASLLRGADISYFVSFIAAMLLFIMFQSTSRKS
jgi:NCS1 family nucleobase:cation symporter-1